ncbi:MAG: RidA family protein [Candidatus Diapherotrites archaeon]
MGKVILNPKRFIPQIDHSHRIKRDMGAQEIIFVNGQVAVDRDGKAIAPKNFSKQADFVFRNIQKILRQDGASFSDVVKETIYLTDISKFKDVSAVRNRYFANANPASTLVEVKKTAQKGCDLAIEVIAIRNKEEFL